MDEPDCPACGEQMQSDYGKAPYCDNRDCKYYRKYFHEARCPTCSKRVWIMLEELQPHKTLYCKEHAKQKRELAVERLVRKAPILLANKFFDEFTANPELAFHNWKVNKYKKELRGLAKH